MESRPKAEMKQDWHASLDAAIQSGNDNGLWALLAQHDDQVEAHSTLATQIARIAYTVSKRPRFSEMFLVPVIDSVSCRVVDETAAWENAAYCIGEALDGWLPPKVRKTVFSGIRPYDWIGTWRPAVLRTHLQSTIPGGLVKHTTFLTEAMELPPEAPKLGFLCMVLTDERGWPRLPAANTLRDNRFKAVVGMALQSSAHAECPTVLAPDRMQFAVADGLCLWLHQLHEAVPVTGWTAAPLAASPDVVKVSLALDSESVKLTQFTLRKHQIGLDGVESVLAMLQSLAPVMDEPMDMPRTAKQSKTVPLT